MNCLNLFVIDNYAKRANIAIKVVHRHFDERNSYAIFKQLYDSSH